MGGFLGVAEDTEQFDYDAELARQKNPRSVDAKLSADQKLPADFGVPRRSIISPDKIVDAPYDGVNTIWAAFMRGVEKFPNNHVFGIRRPPANGGPASFYWITYRQAYEQVKEIGLGLKALGCKPGDKVGICSANRVEWSLSALAIYGMSMTVVALYDTLGVDAVEYILNHAECTVALASKAKLGIVQAAADKCPKLKHIVQFNAVAEYGNANETVSEDDVKKASQHDKNMIGFTDLKAKGKAAPGEMDVPNKDTLAFIMYTSGTTGVPKGAMLSHGNVMGCVGGVFKFLALLPTDVHISYLPLAHIFETAVQCALCCAGASCGFFSGDIKTLADDLKLIRPTVFCGVPRVFTRFHQRFTDTIAAEKDFKRKLVWGCYWSAAHAVRRGNGVGWLDSKILGKARAKLGMDRLRIVVTGAAPCPPYLMEFIRVILAPTDGVVQGYGLTETAAAVTASEPKDHTLGHVGPPLPSAEICLRDVPDMGYLHTNNPPTGEVLARGPSIFKGYYKNEAATAEALTPDGWLCTGDIGRWNPNGTLSIIDRKKNMFKLAQGEYIAAEKIEQVYQKANLVAQNFVYGNSYKSFVLAIIVPNAQRTYEWLKHQGHWEGKAPFGMDEAFRNDFKNNLVKPADMKNPKTQAEKNYVATKDQIMSELKKLADDAKLHAFERVKDIHLEVELDELLQGFNVANDCMTPTFKLRRPFLVKRYEPYLRELYTLNGEAPKADERW